MNVFESAANVCVLVLFVACWLTIGCLMVKWLYKVFTGGKE
jgi:hypothetical protein